MAIQSLIAPLRERVLVKLRGEGNSVRYRFYGLPKQWLKYLMKYRLRGRSWINFYADRLDVMDLKHRDEPLAETYVDAGYQHLEYLKNHGLKPHHYVLDYGCGVMRAGIPLIKYLEPGHYVGVDISGERLAHARVLVAKEGIQGDDYHLFTVSDCSLRELKSFRFDFVWAKSVLTHMPAADIRALLKSLKTVMNDDGVFLFTFVQAEKRKRRNMKDFYYTRDLLLEMIDRAGFRFNYMDDWDASIEGDHMGELRLA